MERDKSFLDRMVMKVETKHIPISKIVTNSGQIDGVPKNPRFIKDDRYKALVKSIQDDPEMLELRELIVFPVNGKFVTIAGNMRFKAMQELKFTEAPCKVLDKKTPPEKIRAYAVKDNVPFGEHDWELLANEWDSQELKEWGIEVLDYSDSNKEIDTDELTDDMVIKLNYTSEEFWKVKEQLSKVAETPEAAVWKLLGNESA